MRVVTDYVILRLSQLFFFYFKEVKLRQTLGRKTTLKIVLQEKKNENEEKDKWDVVLALKKKKKLQERFSIYVSNPEFFSPITSHIIVSFFLQLALKFINKIPFLQFSTQIN